MQHFFLNLFQLKTGFFNSPGALTHFSCLLLVASESCMQHLMPALQLVTCKTQLHDALQRIGYQALEQTILEPFTCFGLTRGR